MTKIYQITYINECYNCDAGHISIEGYVTTQELADHYRNKYGYSVEEIHNIDDETIEEIETEARSKRLRDEREAKRNAERRAQSEAMMNLARPHLLDGEEVAEFNRGFGIDGVSITIRTPEGRYRTINVKE